MDLLRVSASPGLCYPVSSMQIHHAKGAAYFHFRGDTWAFVLCSVLITWACGSPVFKVTDGHRDLSLSSVLSK